MAFPIVIEIVTVTLGNAIREKRRQLHLTQRKLADQLGVSVSAVQEWESRERFPRPAQLRRLAEWLGIHKGLLRL